MSKNTRYEMVDRQGRYMLGNWNEDEQVLTVTMYLTPKQDVPIEEVLEMSGFTITSKIKVEKPKVLKLATKGDSNE